MGVNMNNDNLIFKSYNKIKCLINDINLKYKIENKFKKDNQKFTIYTKDSLVPCSCSGFYKENKIIIYGNHLNKINSFIVNNANNKVYKIVNTKSVDLKIDYENIEYIKQGTIIFIDDNIEEVSVIKVGTKYYKYK